MDRFARSLPGVRSPQPGHHPQAPRPASAPHDFLDHALSQLGSLSLLHCLLCFVRAHVARPGRGSISRSCSAVGIRGSLPDCRLDCLAGICGLGARSFLCVCAFRSRAASSRLVVERSREVGTLASGTDYADCRALIPCVCDVYGLQAQVGVTYRGDAFAGVSDGSSAVSPMRVRPRGGKARSRESHLSGVRL